MTGFSAVKMHFSPIVLEPKLLCNTEYEMV